MREDLLPLLRCPESAEPLELARVERWFALDDPSATGQARRHVVTGLLRGRGPVAHAYPILDEIPRLVPQALLSADEIAYASSRAAASATADGMWTAEGRESPEVITAEQVDAEIRRRMEHQYRLGPSTPADVRRRCEGEIRYMRAEARGRNKQKYVRLLEPYLGRVPSLLEMGGNFPGLSRSLGERYRPRISVVGNIQILFPMAFKTPEREIAAVRADVQALPFAPSSFDLVVSGFMLEHVPDWKAGLGCMMEAGGRVFLAFGPNKWFPFEVGHIDAPLAGTLPAPLDAYVAWAWLAARGRRRPLHRIREILGEVFHVGAKAFEREARRLGGRTTNLFPELVDTILADDAAPATGPRKLLKRAPGPARLAARTLARLGMEPQIYYLIET